MIKTIKKIGYILMVLFLTTVLFILMAEKFDWLVNSDIVPIFLIILILTLLCMIMVSISVILQTINKNGKKSFGRKFIIRWILFFVPLYVASFLKNDINILVILASSFLLSIFSYYYGTK